MGLQSGAREDRHGLLIKKFDAEEQWVAWSSGLAPGLFRM